MLARFPRRPILTLVGAVALVIAIANPAAAPPGDLDSTFDGDGKVTTDFARGFDEAFGVAIQGDGKIVAAGSAVVSGTEDFALARYNADGSLDSTFDGDGKVTTDFAGSAGEAFAVAIQADGKIVAAGFAVVSGDIDLALARYNTDGSLDPTFDGDGKVTTDFAGSADEAFAAAIQEDGKIVAAGGDVESGIFGLARYNSDGSLDTTFDGDGLVTRGLAGVASAVAIQADGKIVAAGLGFADASGSFDFGLARYNTDGSLDPTFDRDGKVTTDFGGDDEPRAVAIQADGKIVAAGFNVVSGNAFALARYNTDGSLDPTFDGDGKVTTAFAGNADPPPSRAVAIQADGKIVAAGFAGVSGIFDFALARYNTDGSLDPTFDRDGKVTTDFFLGLDEAHGVAIQEDGKVVAAGDAVVSGNDGGGPPNCAGRPATIIGTQVDFALARYNTDGSLDTTFGGGREGDRLRKGVILGLGGKDSIRAGGAPYIVCAGWTSLKATLSHMRIPRREVGLVFTVGFLLMGLLLGRLWLLLLPAIVWSLFFVIAIVWWGSALGGGWQSGLAAFSEGWQYELIANILVGVATVAVGLFLRRLVLRAAPWWQRVRS